MREITAVLGPTNTGKTHYAIERMLGHATGVIGLPLRLLAREVYEKLVDLRGLGAVALLTGEERIVPPKARYYVCTVEAMPLGMAADFVAVDEIQLCADPDRGHIFTQRLLHSRGSKETLFMGASSMRARIESLVPDARFLYRERFSELTYSGPKKISRMPARAAIVAFSVENVYQIAELIRRQKGGAAVVMGALSPRTRNAQVEMYQNGEVDYLVATDAIGMGLNLDISHVAFAGLSKFDGRRMRYLMPNELAQIAGRAGRYMENGTFGVTGEAHDLEPEWVEAIENHRFSSIKKLEWRNPKLDFGSLKGLVASLERGPDDPELLRAREADDLRSLKGLASMPDVIDQVRFAPEVRRLWEVCQIPDFRKLSGGEHVGLLAKVHAQLSEGHISEDWMAQQVKSIDRVDGGIDQLSKRLAFIRTWTYVAQRKDWLRDVSYWRSATRKVEDSLSDALHARLTQRFVDRRTSVLMRRLKQKERLLAQVSENGDVTVEDQFIGKLDGFRFILDPKASDQEAKTLRATALAALQPVFNLRSDKMYNAPDTEFDFTEQGGLMWGDSAVGKLVAGADALSPQIDVFVDEEAGPEVAEKVRRRLGHWMERKIAALFEPLLAIKNDEALAGLARGVGFQIVEALGVIPRGEIAKDIKELDQDARATLRKHGVRFGQFTIFQHLMLKPAPTRMRLVLWSLQKGLDVFPEAPPPGLVTVPAVPDAPEGYYARAGYRLAGERSIRIDMLERLADMLRGMDSRGGFEANADMLSITGLTLEQFANLMAGLGYAAERGERPKVKPTPEVAEPQPEPEAKVEGAEEAPKVEEGKEAESEPAEEAEVFYTFRWATKPRAQGQRQNKGEPRGKKPAKGKRGKPQGKPTQQARPPRKDKPFDPDNPFAALAALKAKD
ncbi:MAG: disulfide oxidoreductase [Rhodobacteraceae bacterium]|nr:disulfide oxidoreductase [Paracoccaceae bacterium]